jgi:hypothetical protein
MKNFKTSGLSGSDRELRNKPYNAGWGLTHSGNEGVQLSTKAELVEVEKRAAGHRRVLSGCSGRWFEGILSWATLRPRWGKPIPPPTNVRGVVA